MKIGIIGSEGVVGKAVTYGMQKLGHEVKKHDISLGTEIYDVFDAELVYICVPTPSLSSGKCDTTIVEKVVDQLLGKNHIEYEGIVAIKSTVEPGTTKKLTEKYNNGKICFVPEFLRERCAVSDFQNMSLLVIGTANQEVFNTIKTSHGDYPKNIRQLSATEAELIKYYSNCFNAVRVIFANEMYEVCSSLGTNYKNIKDAYTQINIPNDYLDCNDNFRGYAGVCLPKDVKAMAQLVKELGLDMGLFDFINKENDKFKPTVPDDMRIE